MTSHKSEIETLVLELIDKFSPFEQPHVDLERTLDYLRVPKNVRRAFARALSKKASQLLNRPVRVLGSLSESAKNGRKLVEITLEAMK